MALVHELVLSHIPLKRRQSPRGWTLFDAVCCHHRGHNQDQRHRGNLLVSPDGVIGYNCYNCGFKARFTGSDLSKSFESLMHWMGIPHNDIQLAKLELLKNKIDGVEPDTVPTIVSIVNNFDEIDLPKDAVPIESVAEWEEIPADFLEVFTYLQTRGLVVAEGHDYYWSASTKHDMNKRLIVPFYHSNNIVGWTARYAGKPPPGVPRYYNSQLQPGYLFNNEMLSKHSRKYALLVEGPFDAIAVDGVGVLGSELSKEQLAWLLQSDKEIIVVPDRQRKNQGLIDAAIDNGWYVSFPDWEDNIKDCADASARYGKIYTLKSIFENKTRSELQISIKRQMYKG